LILSAHQFARALLGCPYGVIVPCDATDRAVLLGIAIHAQQVVAIAVIAEKITEESPVNWLGSVFVNPLFSNAVLTQVPLTGRSQLALIASIEGDKAEWLQTPRDGFQHFCRAKYHSRMSHEHELDAATTIQWFGQAQEATRERNYLQFALPAATILRFEDGRSYAREANPGTPLNRVRLRCHGPIRVWSGVRNSWRLRKDSDGYGYPANYSINHPEPSADTPAFKGQS